MNDDNQYFEVIVYNDHVTPSSFVSKFVSRVFGVTVYESDEIVRRISSAGKYSFGPYPEGVARAIVDEASRRIAEAKHPLLVEAVDLAKPESTEVVTCSFCGKASTAVEKIFESARATICDECIVRCAGALKELIPTAGFRYTYQLLDAHFGKLQPDTIVKISRSYPGRVRADLQLAIEKFFTSKAIRSTGVKQQYGHEKIDLATLWTSGRNAHGIAPVSYEELDVGEKIPVQCQLNGLWLLQDGENPYAAILSRETDYAGGYTIFVEISGPQGEGTAEITRQVFDGIESLIRAAHSYRGKVLSLEQSPHYSGRSSGITVHKKEPVRRDQIILPDSILENLDRTIVRFCEMRDRLREFGLQTKRGVLFFGSPGTGKTHTVRYLASQLSNHTTFLVTAEQIGLLPEYFALARLMQPVIFVIEDADLLAKARESMHGLQEEVLLNHLLNEMDGLKEDADILFLLSSNKPEVLEEALVDRPGRIDQLIEFPKPDNDCRHRLMQLYGGSLTIAGNILEDLADRTKGVSASFIKELMRRLAQYSIERGGNGEVLGEDVDQALEEMLFSNGVLNRSILGAGTDG